MSSETMTSPDWLKLPSDLTVNILQRIGVVEILDNVEKVCTAWRDICMDPALWRVICMDSGSDIIPWPEYLCIELCKHAVDRSQGQLIDLTLVDYCDNTLLQYIGDRSNQVRHLQIISRNFVVKNWSRGLKKFSLLEKLDLYGLKVYEDDIEVVGSYCPLLKTLKVNHERCAHLNENKDDVDDDEMALAIGKNLPHLTHLELRGTNITNIGLQAILDGCGDLESLDLRMCCYVDLKGDLEKRCFQQIEDLKRPYDSPEGCPFHKIVNRATRDATRDGFGSDDEYGYFDYSDHYNGYFDYDECREFEDMNERLDFLGL